jgi:hypothetical protein
MSCDNTKINTIENNLKSNPSSISDSDLIYYLYCKTNNSLLDYNNLNNTETYLKKINNSFYYENIFVNTSNYHNIVPTIIGLLIPFYYFYPRFYNIGPGAYVIGIISFLTLYMKTNSLYSNFFNKAGIIFLFLTVLIYIIFFVVLNKLNHISLFFISAIISYLIINYLCRVVLSIPTKHNKYNQYRATMNNNTNFTQFNTLLETACSEVISRYKLTLPSQEMLYTYLTEFEIGDNDNIYTDFITNLAGPFLSIIILWLLGSFLSLIKENGVNLFPIIGIDDDSEKYFTCQANYILPKELNVDLLIYDLLEKYEFDNKTYGKVEKALLRISKELLTKYNPKFVKIENEDKKLILDNLKGNKIFIQINKILKKNNFNFDMNYIDEIKKIINDEDIPYKEKTDMSDLLLHIDNTLYVNNDLNEKYENDSILARDELLYDKDIDEKNKPTLEKIINIFIKNFTNNLNLKDGTLFGYHYNIITYSLFNSKVKVNSNKIFKKILRLISAWLIFAKPVGSSWLIVKYILISSFRFKTLIRNMNESFLWKYFSMGLNSSYFEDVYKGIKNNNENTIIKKALNIFYSVLMFSFIAPLLYFYNSTVFGFTTSPLWYNLIYQIAFIINIIGNISCYYSKQSILWYNITFFVAFIVIIVAASLIKYYIKNKVK